MYLVQYPIPQSDNALFHIFAGPLFVNADDYANFDLLIWAVSPLIFLCLRDKLVSFFADHTRQLRGTTMFTFIACTFSITCSYFFLNVSPFFRWNNYSVTFNLDVGYFIFDFVIRTFEVLGVGYRFWWNYSQTPE